MATRLYLTAATAPVTPAAATYTVWTGPASPGPTTIKLARPGVWPGATTFTTVSQTKGNTTSNTDHCIRKFVSDPLIGAQSISNTGTLRGQTLMAESAATANAHTQIVVKVVSNDGATLRGTLYTGDSRTGTVDELGTGIRNENVPAATIDPVTLTNTVSAQDGDRILVEIGFRANSTTSTHGCSMRYGSTATPGGANDLAIDGAEITDLNGWVEFSQNFNFEYTTGVRVSFPTPATAPSTGAGLQEFRAKVRKKVNDANQPLARIELWENGSLVSTPLADTPINSTTGTVIVGTWDASTLTTASGANVECRVVGTGVGANNLEVGAIEWNKLPEEGAAGAVGKDLSLPWNDRAALGDSLVNLWNIRSAVGGSASLLWSDRAALGNSVALPWNDRAATGNPLSLPWNTLAATGGSLATLWNDYAAIGDPLSLLWNVQQTGSVGKDLSLPWNDRAAVGSGFISLWNERAAIGDPLSALWNIQAAIGDPTSFLWHTRTAIGDPLALVWQTDEDTSVRVSFTTPDLAPDPGPDAQEFRAWVKKVGGAGDPLCRIELWESGTYVATVLSDTAVTSTTGQLLSGTWDSSLLTSADGSGVECRIVGTGVAGATLTVGAIEWNATVAEAALSAVAKEVRALWNARAALGDPLSLPWNVLVPIGDTLIPLWNIYTPLGDTVALPWNIRAAIGDPLISLWNVRAAMGNAVALPWNIRAALGNSVALPWNVRVAIGDPLAFLWNDRAALGDNLIPLWNVRSAVGDPASLLWNVLTIGAVGDTVALQWNIRSALGTPLALSWNDRAAIGDPLVFLWNDRAALGDNLTPLWNVRSAVGDPASLLWNVLAIGAVGDTVALQWNVRTAVSDTLTPQWNIYTPVGDTLTSVWHIYTPLGDNLIALWNVRATSAAEAVLRWRVNVLGAQALYPDAILSMNGFTGDVSALRNDPEDLSDITWVEAL